VNGDEVRDTRFLGPTGKFTRGYDAAEVDELLGRIAAELDAGRQVRPLIENAVFRARTGTGGYDAQAVDWFLEQLRWVLTSGRHLWSVLRGELLTAEQQAVASVRSRSPDMDWPATVSAGGRTFTWKRVTGSAWPGIAEIVRRSDQDYGAGRSLDADTPDSRKPQATASSLKRAVRALREPIRELLNETGTPILYASGQNYNRGAGARITFPDQRWLKFPVRGTERANAIMTAVDQAGNKVARYRDQDIPDGLRLRI
jgi:DivIVA domain-containing protein